MQCEQAQKADFQAMVNNAKAAADARNREIAGRCPQHGDFTYGDLSAIDSLSVACPKCQEAGREKKTAAERHKWLEEKSGIPRRFRTLGFSAFRPPVAAAKRACGIAQDYAHNFAKYYEDGRSLVLYGRTGTGKSMLACAMARHIILTHGRHCKYATAYHIVRDIKATFKNGADEKEVVKGFIEPALLIVDEVGVQFGTDTEKLLLFEVLNGRYEEIKPSIVISNLNQSEIVDYLGDRALDRMRENGGAALLFDWDSHRH